MDNIKEVEKLSMLFKNELLNFDINNFDESENFCEEFKFKRMDFFNENKNTLIEKIEEIKTQNLSAKCEVDFQFNNITKFVSDTCSNMAWNSKKCFVLSAPIDLIKKILDNSKLYVYYFEKESYRENVCRVYTKKEENGGEFIMEI